MEGFITMIRDISDVAHNVKHVTKHNAEIIASEIPGWTGTNSGTLLTPIANTTHHQYLIQGVLLENTIIKGTDNSGLTIGDVSQNLGSYPAYHIAMGMSGEMSPARAATAGFMYRDRSNNTFVFDSGGKADGGRLLINGHPVGAHDAHFSVPGDLLVHGTIESSGVILQPVHSAEGSSQSVITDLEPSTNPLMSKGMLWINKAQDASSAWSYIASMDISRQYFGAAALGGKIYVAGGTNTTGIPYAFASGEVYDPTTNSWSAIANMNTDRRQFGMAALGGKLYAVGGVNINSPSITLATGEMYDPNTDSWSAIANLNTSRYQLGMAAMGGKLYAVGGYNNPGSGALGPLSSVEVYDPIDNSWSFLPPMLERRDASPGVAALGGRLYVVGAGEIGAAARPEVYDPITNSWSYIANMVVPPEAAASGSTDGNNRIRAGVVALGGKLYVVGGRENLQSAGFSWLNSVEVYDPIYNSWNLITSLNARRAHLRAVTLAGRLYAIGGWRVTPDVPVDGATNSVEVYDPSLVQMPQITHQGEDFYVNVQRGGPKTFVIQHPEHEGKKLRHACLEAPTRGTNVYEYQFEATEDNQTTEIALPSYFKLINGRPRVYVYCGAGSQWSGSRAYMNDDHTKAIIETEKPGTFNVMVTGVRKDPEAVAYSESENIDTPIALEDIPSSQN